MPETATLLVSCPDRKGLVSGISNFIFRNGGNILQSDQYTDVEAGIFLARFEFRLDGFQIPAGQIRERFRSMAQEFSMEFEIHFSDDTPGLPYLLRACRIAWRICCSASEPANSRLKSG